MAVFTVSVHDVERTKVVRAILKKSIDSPVVGIGHLRLTVHIERNMVKQSKVYSRNHRFALITMILLILQNVTVYFIHQKNYFDQNQYGPTPVRIVRFLY
jgi:hypothetical protein